MDLDERLGLISEMLEEAVTLLRATMSAVREEEDGGRAYDDPEYPAEPGRGPDR